VASEVNDLRNRQNNLQKTWSNILGTNFGVQFPWIESIL